MKYKGFLAFFAFLALFVASLEAQQEGSVAIAQSVRAENEDSTLSGFTKCVADLKESGVKDKAAIKACTKMANIIAHTTTRVANEAADATKSSRPLFVNNGWGPSYGYPVPVVQRTVIRRHVAVRRSSPPPVRRSLPPSRPSR